jgi:hypothetical protein
MQTIALFRDKHLEVLTECKPRRCEQLSCPFLNTDYLLHVLSFLGLRDANALLCCKTELLQHDIAWRTLSARLGLDIHANEGRIRDRFTYIYFTLGFACALCDNGPWSGYMALDARLCAKCANTTATVTRGRVKSHYLLKDIELASLPYSGGWQESRPYRYKQSDVRALVLMHTSFLEVAEQTYKRQVRRKHRILLKKQASRPSYVSWFLAPCPFQFVFPSSSANSTYLSRLHWLGPHQQHRMTYASIAKQSRSSLEQDSLETIVTVLIPKS